jgi:hypothetical protein
MWAAKTAYLISYTAVQQDRVGTAHLRSLAKDSTLPTGVCVAAAQHAPTGRVSFIQKNSWPGEIRYLFSAGLHVPMWPPEQFYPSYYSGVEIAPDLDSRVALEHFSTVLAAIHQPPSGLVTIPHLYVKRR